MQNLLSGSSLFAHVMMQRQIDDRLVLLVEGDDDVAVFKWHLNTEDVLLLAAGGKPTLLQAAHLFDSRGVTEALVVVDRDLDEITGADLLYPPNVVASAGYDLVTDLLVAQPVLLERVMTTICGPEIETSIQSATGKSAYDVILEAPSALTALRLANQLEGWGLNLREYPVQDVLDRSFKISNTTLLATVSIGRSASNPAVADVTARIEGSLKILKGDRRYQNGHDIMRAAAVIARSVGNTGIGAKMLEQGVFLATNCLFFMSIAAWATIARWAATHGKAAFSCPT